MKIVHQIKLDINDIGQVICALREVSKTDITDKQWNAVTENLVSAVQRIAQRAFNEGLEMDPSLREPDSEPTQII